MIIGEGVHIEPDLYSEIEKIVCEIYAHIGNLKVGQQHKVSQDILKMLLLDKCKGVRYRKVVELCIWINATLPLLEKIFPNKPRIRKIE